MGLHRSTDLVFEHQSPPPRCSQALKITTNAASPSNTTRSARHQPTQLPPSHLMKNRESEHALQHIVSTHLIRRTLQDRRAVDRATLVAQSSTSLTGHRLEGNRNDTAWQPLFAMQQSHAKAARTIVSVLKHDPTHLVQIQKPPGAFNSLTPKTAEAKTRPLTPTTLILLQHRPYDTPLQVISYFGRRQHATEAHGQLNHAFCTLARTYALTAHTPRSAQTRHHLATNPRPSTRCKVR